MVKLTTEEIRNKWLNFFESKKHLFIPSISLIPVNDPSLLWINSGVATLKDYFIGKLNPPSPRLTNSQLAIRTNDIENIGITSRHHSIFEMLGNFSIGDYFKEEAIQYAHELLVNIYSFDINRLYITVYEKDETSYNKWISLGIDKEHIIKGNKERNFWDIGQGPCGPCTEIFFDRGEKYDLSNQGIELFNKDIENDRYIEIWNIVFSEFNNDGTNQYSELTRKNIDTGAGLERLACVIQDVPTNFDTDHFQNIIKTLEVLCEHKYDMNAYFDNNRNKKEINKAFCIIVDHIKANVFAISDGAVPSNKERGAILRRLLRRAMVFGRKLNINKEFMVVCADAIINEYHNTFPILKTNKNLIIDVIAKEQKTFEATLENGFKLFDNEIAHNSTIDPKTVFKLVDTYGFPYEIIKELCIQQNIKFDEDAYFTTLNKHKEISKANLSVGMNNQMKDLINFENKSEFIYELTELFASKIIGLYNKDFKIIEEANKECWIILDKTIFYATSGGQLHDKGTIQINNKSYDVIDVIKAPNGQHLHLINLNNDIVNLNDVVNLSIDKVYRYNVSRNHTTEHLLEHVMNKYIDSSIKQEGAFKSDAYFTFDFNLPRKLTTEELNLIENKVNEIIKNNVNVCTTVKDSIEEAKTEGTVGHFDEKYKQIKGGIRVVNIDTINNEICGGTHVSSTGNIEKFMIVEYISNGVGKWRIRGITSNQTIDKFLFDSIEVLQLEFQKMKNLLEEYKLENTPIWPKLNEINYEVSLNNLNNLKLLHVELKKEFDAIVSQYVKDQKTIAIANIKLLQKNISDTNNICFITCHSQDPKNIVSALNEIANEDKSYLYIGINNLKTKLQYILICDKSYTKLTANDTIKKINLICNGSGGGNNFFAQGGTNDFSKLDDIIDLIKKL